MNRDNHFRWRRKRAGLTRCPRRYGARAVKHQAEALEQRLLLAGDPLLTDFVLFSVDDLTVHRETLVASGLAGSGNGVRISRDARIQSVVAGQELWVDACVEVAGQLAANGQLRVGSGALILGDVEAGERIELERDSFVAGSVTSGADVVLEAGATVQGTVTEYASPAAVVVPELPVAGSVLFDGSADLLVDRNGVLALAPGAYGDLLVGREAVLSLSAGEYFFERIDVARNTSVQLDVTAGDISIFVAAEVTMGRGLRVQLVGGDADRVYMEAHNTVSLGRDTQWFGTIFAPFDNISINLDTLYVGAAYGGGRIDVARNTALHHHPARRLVRPTDITPPDVLAQLTDDTGILGDDHLTANPAVMGMIADESPIVQLTLTVPELAVGPVDVTTFYDPASGRFALDRLALQSALARTLDDGTYTYRFLATDQFGNVSAPFDVRVTLDTAPPAAPVVTTVDLDTGLDPTDGITRDNTPRFSGTAEPLTSVLVSLVGGDIVGIAVVEGDGSWAVDLHETPLLDGSYQLVAGAIDQAGNEGPGSAPRSIQIDTLAPDAPSVALDPADDTPPLGDSTTAIPLVALVGMSEPLAMIGLFPSGAQMIADASGQFRFAEIPLTVGNNRFTATATDLAGNVSSSDFAVTRVQSPDADPPLLSAGLANDTGPSNTDGLTTDPTITGFVMDDGPVTLFLSIYLHQLGQLVSAELTSRVGPDGRFTIDEALLQQLAGQPLPHGYYDVALAAVDASSNLTSVELTIGHERQDGSDVLGPLTQIALLNDTGPDPQDGFTVDPTVVGSVVETGTFTLELEVFFEQLQDSFSTDIRSRVAPDGSFVLDATLFESLIGQPLPFGYYDVTVSAVDELGNRYDAFLFVAHEPADGRDVFPPELSVHLANDDGPDPTDGVTSDPTLAGRVVDQSTTTLVVAILGGGELPATADITSLVGPDGSFTVDRTLLENLLGGTMPLGSYLITFEAVDAGGNRAFFDVHVTLDNTPGVVPYIASVSRDTAAAGDGVTADGRLIFAGAAEPDVTVRLHERTAGVIGAITSDATGAWSIDARHHMLSDGSYEFYVTTSSRNPVSAGPSVPMAVLVDTVPPAAPVFELDPSFDTGPVGDRVTSLASVTLRGQAEPLAILHLLHANLVTTADEMGSFQFTDVPLGLGLQSYALRASDAAGNTSETLGQITREHSFTLSERSHGLTESAVLVELGKTEGARRVSFQLHALFDEADRTTAPRDMLLVYLVDPMNPAHTLVDRGTPGTALLMLSEQAVDYAVGVVSFDGSVANIDVSGIDSDMLGQLVFQLVGGDADTGTSVTVSDVANILDVARQPLPLLRVQMDRVVAPGPPRDLASLTVTNDVEAVFDNVRIEGGTGRYRADLRLRNHGGALGREAVVVLDGLPEGVRVANASGSDDSGHPYVNMTEAIGSGGLPSGADSRRTLLEIDNPSLAVLRLSASVLVGGPNRSPALDPFGPLTVPPGGRLDVPLVASDADGDRVTFSIRADGPLPTLELDSEGLLAIMPTPSEVGSYSLELIARDGVAEVSRTIVIDVPADPVTTTRISGRILDTDSNPLVGVPIELAGNQTLTATDGTFQLEFATPPADVTLIVHGEVLTGPLAFPFIAEKLQLLLEHELYPRVNNAIARPIYLPPLDTANAVLIDPHADTLVATAAIPEASVFVAAGSLRDQTGDPYTGTLGITEVPVDRTPAALPEDLDPDIVVTIQPGEMVFTLPAPLTLPNRAGYPAGLLMDLWSINPQTGLFDAVGSGVVSADGARIETLAGGIRNSSWHFFAPRPAIPKNPEEIPQNQDKLCDDCERRHDPDGAPPVSGPQVPAAGDPPPSSPQLPGWDDFVDILRSGPFETRFAPTLDPFPPDPVDHRPRLGPESFFSDTRFTIRSPSMAPNLWGPMGEDQGRDLVSDPIATLLGESSSARALGSAPAMAAAPRAEGRTEVALHSGAVLKSHALAPYHSVGSWHGLVLQYDSERADPRPIVHYGYTDTATNVSDLVMRTTIDVFDLYGDTTDARSSYPSLLRSEQHYFAVGSFRDEVDASVQVDLRDWPTGLYGYRVASRFQRAGNGAIISSQTPAKGSLALVNTTSSPFGAGWGLAGLDELIEVPGGVMLVNGDGSELFFGLPTGLDRTFRAPAGDFSTLVKVSDTLYRRTMTDQTTYEFQGSGDLFDVHFHQTLVRDRHGNETRYELDNGRLTRMVDPVGLETVFSYTGDRVTTITDPGLRQTHLDYDADGNLIRITDPDATNIEFGYDNRHHLVEQLNKRGDRESIAYDFAGRARQVIRADSTAISYAPAQTQGLLPPEQTLDPLHPAPLIPRDREAIAWHTDGNGNMTRSVLDRAGQLVSSSDGAGALGSVERNADNLVQRMRDARGNTTLVTFDDRGNVAAISDAVSRSGTNPALFAGAVFDPGVAAGDLHVVDMNQDNVSDLIMPHGDRLSVFLGHGDDSFHLASQSTLTATPRAVTTSDLNKDGKMDVVSANQFDSVAVLLGNGDGTLRPPEIYETGDLPQFVELADLNADGADDLLVVTQQFAGLDTVTVLLGDADGKHRQLAQYGVADFMSAVAIGDLDQNGTLDVVTADRGRHDNIHVLFGVGDGTLSAPVSLPMDSAALVGVWIEDWDRDGRRDVLAAGGSELITLLGNGDGTFEPALTDLLEDDTGAPVTVSDPQLLDVDRDGDLDLMSTQPATFTATVFVNGGAGELTFRESIRLLGSPTTFGISDIDVDGSLDLVALVQHSTPVAQVVHGMEDGSFQRPVAVQPGVPVGNGPVALLAADFNGDSIPDVVVANADEGTVSLRLGIADGSFGSRQVVSVGVRPVALAAEDVNADQQLDLVVADYLADTVLVLVGDGSGGLGTPMALAVADGPRDLAVGDVDADGAVDIVVAGNRTGDATYSVLKGIGDGTFGPAANTVSNYQTQAVALGDVDSDGRLDLVLGQSFLQFGNRVRVALGNGDGTFAAGTSYGVGTGFFVPPVSDVALVDLDADGHLDILAADPSTNSVGVLLGTGNGSFGPVTRFAVAGRPGSLSAADLDGDGAIDVVVAKEAFDRVSVLRGIGDGRFASRLDYLVGDAPSGVAIADLDGDGDYDFLSADRLSNTVTPRLNQVRDANGPANLVDTRMTYDSVFSQLTGIRDALGRQTLIEVDPADGNRIRVTRVVSEVGGPDDVTYLYSYTPLGLIGTMTDPLGRVVAYDYDALGRITALTHAVGTAIEATVGFEYDLVGNLTAMIDELGHRTSYEYDPLNRVIRIVAADPDGSGPLNSPATVFQYDAAGNLTGLTDALSNTTAYAYDPQNRVVSVTDPHLNSERYTYDRFGNVSSRVDPLGRKTEYRYDPRNRLVEIVDPEAATQHYIYDADNNLLQLIDNNGGTWRYFYDARNRLQVAEDALGIATHYEFDRADNLIAVEDKLGRRMDVVYDELDRVTRTILPDPDRSGLEMSPVFSYQYDLSGNLRFLLDPLGNGTEYRYDERDHLVELIEPDPDGAGPLSRPRRTVAYDDANRVVSVSDPLNRVTTYEYDHLNRQVAVTYPDPDGPGGPDLAPQIRTAYDAVHNERSMTDALGNTTVYDYDALYRLIAITAPDPDSSGPLASPVTTFAYDDAGQLVAATDPLGRTTRYEYDRVGRLVSETLPDPDGLSGPEFAPVMTYRYDAVGNRLAVIDGLGNTTQYEYDAANRQIRVLQEDPDGPAGPEANPVTSFSYDAAGQLIALTDPLDRVTRYAYDELGRMIEQTDPDPDGSGGPDVAPLTRYAYDRMDNLLSMTDALANVSAYEYDNLYRLVRTVAADPDGGGPAIPPTTTSSYDIAGQLLSTTDPLGRTTSYEYDDLGRVRREISPDPDGPGPLESPVTTFVYDLMDNQRAQIDALGHVTEYVYDNLYRRIELRKEDPDGAGPLERPISRYTYDLAGQLTAEVDPLGRVTAYEYDQLGRVTRITQPDPDGGGPLVAPATTFAFDAMNNQRATTDPLGHVTHYEYDKLYRLIAMIDEDLDGTGPVGGPTTRYVYDLVGNILKLTDPSGNSTSYVYDNLDRVIEESIELGAGNPAARRFEYDAVGNLIERTDRNERAIRYTYDQLYRPVEEAWFDQGGAQVHSIRFAFDGAGQLVQAEDLTIGSRYDYVYDRLGRVTQSVVDNGGPLLVFTNAYDANSLRTEQSVTVGGVGDYRTLFSYDRLNRPVRTEQLAQSGGNSVAEKRIDMIYNADDQLRALMRYNTLAAASPDLVAQTTFGYDGIGRLTTTTHAGMAGMFADYAWTYDEASRVTQFVSSRDGASLYAYDHGNQLIGADHDYQPDESYAYDENGNRTSGSYATGDSNRLASDGSFTYEYDAEGNRTRRTNIASGEVTEYEWDHRNRLVRVTQRSTLAGPSTRVVEHVYDSFNRWIARRWDADGDGSSPAVTTRYEYDSNQIVLQFDEPSAITHRYLWGPLVDQILADESIAHGVRWPLTDQLGSVRDLIDSSGNTLHHLVYDSFGQITSEPNPALDHLFAFTGRPFDEATGLQNNLHRWYDPAVGRWGSEDPLSFEGGDVNLYRYVANEPTAALDPNGLKIYAIGGTWESYYHNALTSQFVRLSDEPAQYWNGTGSDAGLFNRYFNGLFGATTGSISTSVYNQIQYDLRQDPNTTINLIGWSRGGVAALDVAKRLNREGIEVNWVGLFDPVSQHFRPGYSNGFSITVPPNVANVAVLYHTGWGVFGTFVFPSIGVQLTALSDTTLTVGRSYNADGTRTAHGEVGGAASLTVNDSLQWMIDQAQAAGVRIRDYSETPTYTTELIRRSRIHSGMVVGSGTPDCDE